MAKFDWGGVKIVIKAADCKMRGIKEAVTIRRENENTNRDEGRYTLSHLYDHLINTGKRTRHANLVRRGGGESPLFAITAQLGGKTSE